MKKLLLIFSFLLASLLSIAQYPLYTPAEILQARVGTRDIRLGSYLHKNNGTLQSLKGLHIDSLLIAISYLDSTWTDRTGSFRGTNNLDSVLYRRAGLVIKPTDEASSNRDTILLAQRKYVTGDSARGIYMSIYDTSSGTLETQELRFGKTVAGDSLSSYFYQNQIGVFGLLQQSTGEGSRGFQLDSLGTVIRAAEDDAIKMRLSSNHDILILNDTLYSNTITHASDTLFLMRVPHGTSRWMDKDEINNLLGESQTFSITLFGSQAPVTGTNVISSDFFVVPPEMNGKDIVDVAFAYFTNPGLDGGTANFRVLNNGTPIRTWAAADNITSGNGAVSPSTLNTYQKIYAELTSETIVTNGVGLTFTFTVR